jgi:hypothetical protein
VRDKQPRTINPKPKPGPKPATVAHGGDWESAVKKALDKKRPAEGWPHPEVSKRAPSGGHKQASRLQPKARQARLRNKKGS